MVQMTKPSLTCLTLTGNAPCLMLAVSVLISRDEDGLLTLPEYLEWRKLFYVYWAEVIGLKDAPEFESSLHKLGFKVSQFQRKKTSWGEAAVCWGDIETANEMSDIVMALLVASPKWDKELSVWENITGYTD